MKLTKVLFFATCLLGLIAGAFAQDSGSRGKERVFGYVDPKTGVFHPMERTPLSLEEAAAISPTTGTIVFNVTIQVSSALSIKAVTTCSASMFVNDSKTGLWDASVYVTGTRAGNTITCTVKMPYSLDLSSPATDLMTVDLGISTTLGNFGTTGFYEELNSIPALAMTVPANGATTTKNITTTI